MNGMFRAYDMLVDHLAHIDEAIKQMGKADDGFLRVIKDLRNKQKKEHAKLMNSLIWHWQRKNCEWCKCIKSFTASRRFAKTAGSVGAGGRFSRQAHRFTICRPPSWQDS